MKWSPNSGASSMTLSVPENVNGIGTITRLPGGVECGAWNSDCVNTGGLSLVFLDKQSAWCMPSFSHSGPLFAWRRGS